MTVSSVEVTVPPIPGGATGYRKLLVGVDPQQKKGFAAVGEFLAAGDVVSLPAGSLILIVDKTRTGSAYNGRYHTTTTTYSATVAVHLVTESGLTEVWSRAYKQSGSAFGATTLRKLTQLLNTHPPQDGTATVVREARRPNYKPGWCRYCDRDVPARTGHRVGHGDDVQIECWQSCGTRSDVADGARCELCGVTVRSADAYRVMVRNPAAGTGVWRVQHRESLRCTEQRVRSYEEHQADVAAEAEARRELAVEQQKAAAKREAARQRRAAKKAALEREARETHDLEQARIAGLKTATRDTEEIADKGLGDGRRVRLLRHVDTLTDGTTTVRWAVETYMQQGWTDEEGDPYYEEVEFSWEPDARAAYRELRFEPCEGAAAPQGRRCEHCGKRPANQQKKDSSGIVGMVCIRCLHVPSEEMSFA